MKPVWFDLAVAAVLVFAAFRGAAKGFVWQIAWIAALVLCFTMSGTISPPIARLIPVEAPLNRWIAMFIVYLLAVFVTFWLAHRINDWMEKHRFKEFDRHLGAIFGFTKGVVFSLTVIFFLVTLSAEAREVVLKSKSGFGAALLMDRLHPVIPDEFHDVLEPYIHRLDDAKGAAPLLHSHDGHDESKRAAADRAVDEKSGPVRTAAVPSAGPAEIPSAATDNGLRRRQEMLQKIAAIHTIVPAAQAAIASEIEFSLAGLPDAVTLAVLTDWYVDLTGGDPDPDPATDANTDLDTRIRRRLDAAGVPLNRLSSSLRKRLERAARN